MGLSQHGYMALCYSLVTFLVVALTAYAMYCGYLFRGVNSTMEGFLTNRGQMSIVRMGWAFFASLMGAWVIAGPPAFSPFAGIPGMIMYAVTNAATMPVAAIVGDMIQAKLPRVMSLADFVYYRYGFVTRTYVGLMSGFAMSIGMLAEFTLLGTMFSDLLGTVSYPIIILVGILTMSYTTYGGLAASIYTDTIQGVFSSVLFLTMGFYMAAKFRPTLPKPLPCDPEDPMGFCLTGNNELGLGSIFSLPVAVNSLGFFMDCYWQRAWASDSRRTRYLGSFLAFVGVTTVVIFTGLCGWLAAWAGYITSDTNPNLYLFQALPGTVNANQMVANWMGVLMILLIAVMNTCAIDSYQNGLAVTVSSYLVTGWKKSLLWTRILVVVVNAPLIALGTQGYSVFELYVFGSMVTSTIVAPVLLGLVDRLRPYAGGVAIFISSVLAIILTSVFGVNYFYKQDKFFDPDSPLYNPNWSKSLNDGMHFTWLGNSYNWRFFAMTLGTSLGTFLICTAFNWLWQYTGLRQFDIPGFVAECTHPSLFPMEDVAPGNINDAESGPAQDIKEPADAKEPEDTKEPSFIVSKDDADVHV